MIGVKTCNKRFSQRSLGTWSSVSQVDSFLSEYSADNDYIGTNHSPINLGDYVTIQDGTYNTNWMIVGFDTEWNRGDTNNGWGIALIPRTYVTSGYMNSTHTTEGGYAGSYMHTTLLPNIASALQNVLGSHLQSRRVLLSNAVNTTVTSPGFSGWTGASSSWAWYSAYCTLMSEVQVYGSSVCGGCLDVGEACEKLPIFNFINCNQYSRGSFWLRAVAFSTGFALAHYCGLADCGNAGYTNYVRPLIYIH